MKNQLAVREMTADDINFIIDYFFNASEDFLLGMGALKSKLPNKEIWYSQILSELEKPYPEKQNYYTIWLIDNVPVGHCNINQIQYKKRAFMHLHLWKNPIRQRGLGNQLVKKSLPFFFTNFQLKKIFCQPFKLNPSPNKTLIKVGFDFVKTHTTIPGKINFEQEVNLYILSKEKFNKLD